MPETEIVWPPSLWAAVTPPGPDLPALRGAEAADVAVVGAGFTGLSTALHLRRAGVDAAVMEAAEPGWGASGRNNGQVIPTLSRPDPEDIVRRHGAAGERFVRLLRDSASILFDLAREERIEAEAEQTGWVQPVHSPGRMKIAERRVRQWSAVGANVELLDHPATRELLGSDAWFGGWLNRTGGHVNPLALARGLARSVLCTGGRVFARSPVTALGREGDRWVLRTGAGGELRARALVLATNAYSLEFTKAVRPDIARQVVPVLSWQMATEPVSDNLRGTIIAARQAVSDTHGELWFARYDARNRLVTGGALAAPFHRADRLKPYIGGRLRRIWPQLGEVRFTHVWNGYVGMTRDFLPRIHRLGPDAFAWAGCNGRAVALSVALGRELAAAARGVDPVTLALPFSDPRPVPLHGLARRLAP
ncbi:MAG: FAD-binding oxidoreductase, partial [Acetobacteraceae bacterium]|nr:FAD-binding oxidoreductase [Acetobacteraceae bacterium]